MKMVATHVLLHIFHQKIFCEMTRILLLPSHFLVDLAAGDSEVTSNRLSVSIYDYDVLFP